MRHAPCAVLAVLIAVLFVVHPTAASEITMIKPPGYGTKEVCLSTKEKPSYANLTTTEQQLLRAIGEVNRHSDHYAIDLSYLGTKEDCGLGGDGLIAVLWADIPVVYQHPVHFSGHQSLRQVNDGTPATFVEVRDPIYMNTADSSLPAIMTDPNRLCVALLEQMLHAFGLGHEYDVPSATNANDSRRSCALTEDDIEGLALLYPLDGESDLHCGFYSTGSMMSIGSIAYQGYWYRATTEWKPGEPVWKVTFAQYTNMAPYPGCEELLSFDEDLTVYGVPVLVGGAGYQGAIYRTTFSLNVAEMSLEIISADLVSDVGFGVGVEAP